MDCPSSPIVWSLAFISFLYLWHSSVFFFRLFWPTNVLLLMFYYFLLIVFRHRIIWSFIFAILRWFYLIKILLKHFRQFIIHIEVPRDISWAISAQKRINNVWYHWIKQKQFFSWRQSIEAFMEYPIQGRFLGRSISGCIS